MQTRDEPTYRGILFSKLMMEANLDGRKMETRRAIKFKHGQPEMIKSIHKASDGIGFIMWLREETAEYTKANWDHGYLCPYGKPGDIIYARETIWTHREDGHIAYEKPDPGFAKEYKCTPSIHMPKIHSRFWAELLEVRAEKLLDISGNSCVLEGIEYQYNGWRDYMALCDLKHGIPCYDQNFGPRKSYLSLWDSINGKDSHLLNPWVWVLMYKEVPKPSF